MEKVMGRESTVMMATGKGSTVKVDMAMVKGSMVMMTALRRPFPHQPLSQPKNQVQSQLGLQAKTQPQIQLDLQPRIQPRKMTQLLSKVQLELVFLIQDLYNS